MPTDAELKNYHAVRVALDEFHQRATDQDRGMLELRNQVQTLTGLVQQLQTSMNIAVATVRGRGSTSRGDHD